MDFTGPGIDHHDGAALAILAQDFFADALQILINGRDHVIAGNGRLGDPL